MRAAFVTAIIACAVLPSWTVAQNARPSPVLPESLTWSSPGPGSQTAWALGADKTPGPYVLRVKLASGTKTTPHTHPDERIATVLLGTIYVGFGEVFDESKVVAVPTGAVYVAAPNQPHYVWAKDGDVMYQESGVGPTAHVFVK